MKSLRNKIKTQLSQSYRRIPVRIESQLYFQGADFPFEYIAQIRNQIIDQIQNDIISKNQGEK